MSHKLLLSILLACAFFAFPAFAQTGATTKIAAPATNKADVLTADQAKRALDTLQDDNKRAQMIDCQSAFWIEQCGAGRWQPVTPKSSFWPLRSVTQFTYSQSDDQGLEIASPRVRDPIVTHPRNRRVKMTPENRGHNC